MASSSDKYSKTSNGGIPAAASVTSSRASGVTSLSIDTTAYWPTDTGIKFSTYKVDANAKKIANSQIDWKGVVTGTTINNIVRTGGVADNGNAIGDKCVMMVTAQWAEDLVEALLTSHTQTGALVPAAVQTAIGSGTITNNNLATGIQTSKLSNPYKFSAYRSTAWTTATTFTVVPINAESYDTGNNFDTATGLFTAPIAGFYHFSGSAQTLVPGTGQFINIGLMKNGTETKRFQEIITQANTGNLTQSGGGDLQLNAGDTVGLGYKSTGDGGGVGPIVTYFDGFLVSAN